MMTKERLAELQKDGQAALDRARQLEEKAKAEDRGFSADEQRAYDAELKTADGLLAKIKQGKHDLSIIEQARAIGEAVGFGGIDSAGPGGSREGQRLSFKGMAGAGANKILGVGHTKAVAASGTVVVEQTFAGDPVALGKPAANLLNVIPVQVQPSPQFAYYGSRCAQTRLRS